VAEEVSLLRRLLGSRRRKLLAATVLLLLLAAAAATTWGLWPGEPGEAELFRLAARFRHAELFAEAAAACERLIAEHPEGTYAAGAHLQGAEARECLGQWRKAEDLYEKYLQRFPEHERRAGVRGRLRLLGRVIRYADLVAEKDLPAAKCSEALYDMGRLVRDRMNPYMAARILAEGADRFPKSPHAPEARHAAGMVLLELWRLAGAREQFAKLVAAFPDSRLADDAQFWIGHAREAQGRLLGEFSPDPGLLENVADRKAADLRADVALRREFNPGAVPPGPALVPPDLDEAERRARARELLKSAVQAYQRVVDEHKLSDKAQRALLRIGEINSKLLKDAGAATEAYRQLLEKYPGTPEAVVEQCEVGRAYLRKGKLAEAERLIKLFLASFPNHEKYGDGLLHMAECHRRQKEYIKALDDYQTFLSRYPRSPRAAEVSEEVTWLKKYRL
jgi:TolA-binding protein